MSNTMLDKHAQPNSQGQLINKQTTELSTL